MLAFTSSSEAAAIPSSSNRSNTSPDNIVFFFLLFIIRVTSLGTYILSISLIWWSSRIIEISSELFSVFLKYGRTWTLSIWIMASPLFSVISSNSEWASCRTASVCLHAVPDFGACTIASLIPLI
uniref:Uncharacterized protein n=1 Tax=uncultured marine virus TaxID=186617 RepID=A0A0F7L364_9VIRU|nr:hypothetical protein [uncultured marine virus]